MTKKLEGKIAVITGGNSGLGFATAQLFVEEGAYVYITGRRQKELDAAVERIGYNVKGIQGDVSNLEDLDRLYATVKEESGHIDILFANAGTGEFASLENITEQHYDKIFDTNVKGLLFSVQKSLFLMREGGSIILNASMVSSKGIEAFSVYCASKAAIRSFARCWILDLKKRKIRVNVISPGTVPTEGYSNALKLTAQQISQYESQTAVVTPLGRVGKPEEVAKPVLFLATDDSSYITGIELFVDGGFAQI
ncbi:MULTISPECIES: SDR family NAD(P)-dependent oxidoreductase [Parachlamydia]|jgi:NAD(P)-dependent dehydrogenase (short-subunit alcohol dehydrogenase family)|uniref:Uncharacterized oxidoreductase ykvO n=2 Tax=Parachlamydia acanthamoebae TaxID=83552 RepID=F8L232_PARAV|nr:SDR family oxidoreductase [Parachlamydia acanthamoebae]EFB41303.1 hypothetical protein pah_c047o085 [Parachlamydia acanthamoebae str. Hall's coccus]KIA76950.1 putative oxidoreductase YkvO [Parachlamydia acanthamoebae]CCB87353.1 uncharacterized oxidoreductase ykvO [Parachlamydia acanthamoebae UV-7]